MRDFSINELVACARRELELRCRVYVRLIRNGQMSEETADREIALMQAILDNLETQQQPKLL